MIRELAAYEREPDLVAIREEYLARDGFRENPLFRALVAGLHGSPAGCAACLFGTILGGWDEGYFRKMDSCAKRCADAVLGWPCWFRWRGLRPGNIVAEYTGSCWTEIVRRSSCTSSWEQSFGMNGARSLWPTMLCSDRRRVQL